MTERHEPVGLTIAGGAYVVRERVQGDGAQQLWLGAHVASGDEVLVTADQHYARTTAEQVTSRAPDGPGIATLDYLGDLDPHTNPDYRHYWAMVEHARGRWLPRELRVTEPDRLRTASQLGVSAARILDGLCSTGQAIATVRPELMWMTRSAAVAEVVAISTRSLAMFSLARPSHGTYPVFATRYTAPELGGDLHAVASPSALVYALALMVAEWATGDGYAPAVYSTYGPQPRDLALAMELPDELERLIRQALDGDPLARPTLARFAEALVLFA